MNGVSFPTQVIASPARTRLHRGVQPSFGMSESKKGDDLSSEPPKTERFPRLKAGFRKLWQEKLDIGATTVVFGGIYALLNAVFGGNPDSPIPASLGWLTGRTLLQFGKGAFAKKPVEKKD